MGLGVLPHLQNGKVKAVGFGDNDSDMNLAHFEVWLSLASNVVSEVEASGVDESERDSDMNLVHLRFRAQSSSSSAL